MHREPGRNRLESDRLYRYGNDTYTNVRLRREAAVILDNPELLMMHAQARNDVCHGSFFLSMNQSPPLFPVQYKCWC